MANTFTLPATLVPSLQEAYAHALITADLLGNFDEVQEGRNAKEIAIPKLTLDDIVDYDRVNGYSMGDISLTVQTVTINYDRGRSFGVDGADEIETGLNAAKVLGEFVRTKVAKDKDIFTFSKLAARGTTPVAANLTSADDVIAALRTGVESQFNAGVPSGEAILYIRSDLLGLINDANTSTSKAILEEFSMVKKVPAPFFFTNAKKGGSDGKGAYTKDTTSKDINFMIVHKPAVIDYDNFQVKDIIPASLNKDSDLNVCKARTVGYVDVYDVKKAGVYTHTKA